LLTLFRFFDTEPDNRIPVTDFSSFETCLDRKNDTVQYIGAIDNNYKDPQQVTERYLENAIDAVLAGKSPDPDQTKAIGCSIKTKQL